MTRDYYIDRGYRTETVFCEECKTDGDLGNLKFKPKRITFLKALIAPFIPEESRVKISVNLENEHINLIGFEKYETIYLPSHRCIESGSRHYHISGQDQKIQEITEEDEIFQLLFLRDRISQIYGEQKKSPPDWLYLRGYNYNGESWK